MNAFREKRTILAACAKGVAPFLKGEIASLGYPVLAELETGVATVGTVEDAMRLNLFLRAAQRVLYQLASFRATSSDELYESLVRLPWEDWIPSDGYFTVTSFVKTPTVRDTRFANVRCKDAIVDRIRQKRGRRPDSGNERRGAVVFLFWNNFDCRVYLDTSGESLSKRGYRKIPLEAPMGESLAAAVIAATGWNGEGNFVNPMCGSGTLAIEAALIGLGRAPGLLRSRFAFMSILGFEEEKWKAARIEARNRDVRLAPEAAASGAAEPSGTRKAPKKALDWKIVATDIRPEAIAAAKRNAATAGVERLIEFHVCDFADTPMPAGGGVVILNPEYGERTGGGSESEELYFRIGDFFKQKCQGWTGYVFTGNMELGKKVGLRTSRKILFFNGPIECRLLGFELYAGTKRKSKLARLNLPGGQSAVDRTPL